MLHCGQPVPCLSRKFVILALLTVYTGKRSSVGEVRVGFMSFLFLKLCAYGHPWVTVNENIYESGGFCMIGQHTV